MGGGEVSVEKEVPSLGAGDENSFSLREETEEDSPARVRYIDYLKSPVIGLLVGQGDEQALLTAHQALLITSPWFADACANFSDEVSVRPAFSFVEGVGDVIGKEDTADGKRNVASTS